MASDENPQGKVELKIGNLSFSGEGNQEWLDKQVSKLLDATSVQSVGTGQEAAPTPAGGAGQSPAAIGSLASFLKAKDAGGKQVQRFLATGAWLFHREEKQLTTTLIAKALADNHQKRLGNPSDCLNKNVTKGHCEKTSDGFFITPEGWKELGEEQ